MDHSSSTEVVCIPATDDNQFQIIPPNASVDVDKPSEVQTLESMPEFSNPDSHTKKAETDMPDLSTEIQFNNVVEQTVISDNEVSPEKNVVHEIVEELVEADNINQQDVIHMDGIDEQNLEEKQELQITIETPEQEKNVIDLQETEQTEVAKVEDQSYEEGVEEAQVIEQEEHQPIAEEQVIIEENVEHSTSTEMIETEEIIDSSQEIIQVEEAIEEHVVTEGTIEDKLESSTENDEDLEQQGQAVIDEQVVFNNDKQIDEENHNGNQEVVASEEEAIVIVSSENDNMYPAGSKSIVVTSEDGVESTVRVQEIRDEVTGEIYYVEAVGNPDDDELQVQEIVEEQKKSVSIPSHVLGRNINNPAIDPFRNGKAPPKPRLGVKIPYRNLTSQIVSKQEITDEILERSRRNRDSPSGQNLFAKKLTQALAKKIAPTRKKNNRTGASSSSTTKGNDKSEDGPEPKINNTDLLAILEGDDDDYRKEPEEVILPEPEEVKGMTKELERELALKQLSELPDDMPMQVRGKPSKRSARPGPKTPEEEEKAQKLLETKETQKSIAMKQLEGILPYSNRKSKRSKPEDAAGEEKKDSVREEKKDSVREEKKDNAREEKKVHSSEEKKVDIGEGKKVVGEEKKANADEGKKSTAGEKKSNKSEEKKANAGEEKKTNAGEEKKTNTAQDKKISASEEKKISADEEKKRDADSVEVMDDDLPDLPNNFSASLPLKTYTRKRKPSDEGIVEKHMPITPIVVAESTKKIDLPQGNSAKRIIKKKVIWDPDEATPRKVVKTDDKLSDKKDTPKAKDKKMDKESKADVRKTEITSKSEKSQETNSEESENQKMENKISSENQKSDKKVDKKNILEVQKVDKKLKGGEINSPKNVKVSPKILDTPKATKNQELLKGDKKKQEVSKIEKKSIDSPKMKIPDSTKVKLPDATKMKTPDSAKVDRKSMESPKTPKMVEVDMDAADSPKTEKRGRGRPRKNDDETSPQVAHTQVTQITKKRLTEIDKLLMDEGAANMLYSLKNTEEDSTKKSKPNKSLVSKTNELLNDLQQTTDTVSPKALRKKEAGPPTPDKLIKSPKKITLVQTPSAISRQKSRDSNRSSLQSPPPSPSPMFTAEASRIIRRHSSSSYSSMDGEDEVSRSAANEDKIKMKKPAEVRAGRRKADSSSESPKKKVKREINDAAKKVLNEEMSKNFNKLVEVDDVNKYEEYKTFEVKIMDQLIQLVLTPNNDNNVFITIQMMQELGSILKEFEANDECTVVLISSSGTSFCNGINFKSLVSPTAKKSTAKKMASTIREFLLNLAKFEKVLIAGIHGDVVGLGVTMLPLFDMVIASDSATFSTPYARLGCIAEGGSLLSLSHLSQNILNAELLFSSRKLISSEAQKLGLVTRILWPDKFPEELISITKIMSKQSAQFMEATKKQIRLRRLPTVTAALNSETETLVQHWTSAECQKKFSQL